VDVAVRPLILGLDWSPGRHGGISRYVRDLHAALAAAGAPPTTVVLGDAPDAPAGVVSAASHDDSLVTRLRAYTQRARELAAAADIVDVHFALYAVPALLLRRLRGRHLDQVLVTVGIALVIADLVRLKPDWGAEVRSLPPPAELAGSVAILGNLYPVYRLFLIAFGITLAVALAAIHRRSRVGALIRAGVDDAQMLSALGVDTDRLFAITYAVGVALAGLAGVVAAPVLGLQPGMDVDALVLSLIVVVVGGLGTLGGAQAGAALVGPADTFGKVFVPQFALFFIFAIMALVLLFRPSGLLGRIRVIR
jgi:branched-chain amino acid transport system permease protein